MTDWLTDAVSSPVRTVIARNVKGAAPRTAPMVAVDSASWSSPVGSTSSNQPAAVLESTGSRAYWTRMPSAVAASTTTAENPNITRGFARTDLNDPSNSSPSESGRSGTTPGCGGGA